MNPDPGEIVSEVPTAALPDDVITSDERAQPTSVVDPNQRFGQATALLKIHQHKGGFLVEGTSAVIDPLEANRDAPYARPTLAPSEIEEMDQAQFPRAMLWLMKEWSKSHQEITRWINELRAELGEELRLVIWDDTGFGIPWELLWLGAGAEHDPSGHWLGGLVSVTRWITMFEDNRDPYSDEPTQCDGHVIVHLQEEMAEDYGELEEYTLQTKEQASDLVDFFTRTGNKHEPFGFIYLAAHGVGRRNLYHFKLAGKHMWDLQGKFSALRSRHGLVFLNACESGVHIIDPMLGGEFVHGFAQLFLNEGAQGVIATLGTVGGNYAREVAKGVFRALAAASDADGHDCTGAQIAVVLRELRAQAAREASDAIDDSADFRAFLDKFMYVYYGNPSTTVQLTRKHPSHA